MKKLRWIVKLIFIGPILFFNTSIANLSAWLACRLNKKHKRQWILHDGREQISGYMLYDNNVI